eukprot:352751-Alexandrium_andersonii.AAC.1
MSSVAQHAVVAVATLSGSNANLPHPRASRRLPDSACVLHRTTWHGRCFFECTVQLQQFFQTVDSCHLSCAKQVPDIVGAWSVRTVEKSLTPRDSAWEREYGEFVKETFPDRFQSFREFDAA